MPPPIDEVPDLAAFFIFLSWALVNFFLPVGALVEPDGAVPEPGFPLGFVPDGAVPDGCLLEEPLGLAGGVELLEPDGAAPLGASVAELDLVVDETVNELELLVLLLLRVTFLACFLIQETISLLLPPVLPPE